MTDTQLTLAGPRADKPPIDDMRSLILAMPSETTQAALVEFSTRRESFRDWLRGQLKEGVHFGYIKPLVTKTIGGELHWQSKKWNKKESRYEDVWTSFKTYAPKPSLYKAGADFIVELMNIRDEYSADMDAWAQLGSPKGTFVTKCKLFSKANGQFIGEGRGSMANERDGDGNKALKMSEKRAKVDAVLNGYGLADLFTQDLEDGDGDKQPGEKPAKDPKAPKVRPRMERVTKEEHDALKRAFAANRTARKMPADKSAFETWVAEIVHMSPENATHYSAWMRDDFEKCKAELEGDQ